MTFQFKLDIEETKRFSEKNVIVMTDGKKKFYMKPSKIVATRQFEPHVILMGDGKKKFYMKPVEIEGIQLEPLNRTEMIELGVNESAISEQESFFQIDIEESSGEPEDSTKKKFNSQNPDSMLEAKKLAEEQLARLKAEGKEPQLSESEREELDRLREENADYEAKLTIIAEKQLERKMSELKVPDSEKPYFRENPEALKGFQIAKGEPSTPSPSGSAPLNDSQYGKSLGTFENEAELVQSLRERELKGDREATAVLNQLYFKMFKGFAKGKNQGEHEIPMPLLKDLLLSAKAKEWQKEDMRGNNR